MVNMGKTARFIRFHQSITAVLLAVLLFCAAGSVHANQDSILKPGRIAVFPLCAEEILLELVGPNRIVYVGHPYFKNGSYFSPTMGLTKNIQGNVWWNTGCDALLSLQPDLVILPSDIAEDVDKLFPGLEKAGISVAFVEQPGSIEQIIQLIGQLGSLVGETEKAEQMKNRVLSEIDEISASAAEFPEKPCLRALALYEEGEYPDSKSELLRDIEKITHSCIRIGAIGVDNNCALLFQQITSWNPQLILWHPVDYDTDGSILSIGSSCFPVSLFSAPELESVDAIRNRNIRPFTIHYSQFIVHNISDLLKFAPCETNGKPPVFLGYDSAGCCYTNPDGTEVIRVDEGIREQFTNGLARVKKDGNGKTAVYNSKGDAIIPWTDMGVHITPLPHGLSVITLYPPAGNPETQVNTESYLYSRNSCTLMKIDKRIDAKCIKTGPPFWYVEDDMYGLINSKGEVIISPEYESVSEFVHGYAFVSGDTFHGYIGMEGEKKYPVSAEWSHSYGIYNDTMVVSQDEMSNGRIITSYNVTDLFGNVLLAEDYDWCSDRVSDGWLLVRNEDLRYSYVRVSSKGRMDESWKRALDFSNGFAAVQDDKGDWGFINISGELVIPCQFDFVGTERDRFDGFDQFGRVWVSENGDDLMIDKSGKRVSPAHVQYAGCFHINNDPMYLIVNAANRTGLLDSYGNTVLEAEFDRIELSNNQYLCGEKDGCLRYYDTKGHFIVKHTGSK